MTGVPEAPWPVVGSSGRLLALVPDLMDRSRISAALPGVQFLRSPSELAGLNPQDVVMVDLARPATRAALAGCRAHVIAFVAHVESDIAAQARQQGAAEVLARSVFFRRLRGGADS